MSKQEMIDEVKEIQQNSDTRLKIFLMEKPMKDKKTFISEERNSYEEEERNLYCLCGKLKTKCADLYAHTTGGA